MTLQEAVDQLPTTIDGIVELLKREGIKGTHFCHSCPLAILLSRWVGEAVSVTGPQCRIITKRDYVCLPQAAQSFVELFDAQKFLDLVRR